MCCQQSKNDREKIMFFFYSIRYLNWRTKTTYTNYNSYIHWQCPGDLMLKKFAPNKNEQTIYYFTKVFDEIAFIEQSTILRNFSLH